MTVPTTKIRQNFNQIPADQTVLELELRKKVTYFVFWMLIFESVALFSIMFLQGFKLNGFTITDDTLNILIPATIAQISAMAIIITKYLFSEKK